MKNKIDKNHLGLVLGIFFALLHLIWVLLVLLGVGQAYIDWILPLHFIRLLVTISSFSIVSAVLLLVMAFIGGYVCGWLFAAVWNWVGKKVK